MTSTLKRLSLVGSCALGCLGMRLSQDELLKAGEESGSAWPLDPSLKAEDFPVLCDPALVKESCEFLSPGEPGKTTCVVSEIGESIDSNTASVRKFLADVGLKVSQEDRVECMDLCKAVVGAIDPKWLPPVSDVGCRYHGDHGTVCDIDLSPKSLEAVEFDENDPDFHAGHPRKGQVEKESLVDATIRRASARKSFEAAVLANVTDTTANYKDVSPWKAKMHLANVFRIYPFVDIKFKDPLKQDASKPAALLNGTQDQRYVRVDPGYGNWYGRVEKINVKAQAYVANAYRKMKCDTNVLVRWFGEDSGYARSKVGFVLRSLSEMLSTVEYRLGDECKSTTYAYVFPDGWESMNDDGEYIFYLCQVYFDASEGEQIETLTHEGSHHAEAWTDDVCLEEKRGKCVETAYGRPTCSELARRDPDKSLDNADNFCYYINDMNKYY